MSENNFKPIPWYVKVHCQCYMNIIMNWSLFSTLVNCLFSWACISIPWWLKVNCQCYMNVIINWSLIRHAVNCLFSWACISYFNIRFIRENLLYDNESKNYQQHAIQTNFLISSTHLAPEGTTNLVKSAKNAT